MLSEKLIFALNDVNDTFLEETWAFGKKPVSAQKAARKRTIRMILIAAVITALMGASAFAYYRATMSSRVPVEGTTEYHVLY